MESGTKAFAVVNRGKKFDDPAESFLPSLEISTLVFAGSRDSFYSEAQHSAELLPNATFLRLPDLDHLGGLYQSDLVHPHITAFLERVEAEKVITIDEREPLTSKRFICFIVNGPRLLFA